MSIIGLYSWQKAEVGFPSDHLPKSLVPITGKDTPQVTCKVGTCHCIDKLRN